MTNSTKKVNELREADFREIQSLLLELHSKDYTTEYIRKVLNGQRHNEMIMEMAIKYIETLAAAKQILINIA